MPYTIIDNAQGCSGYAVVKQGETTPIEGGCHELKSAAIAHMVALEIAYQDELEDELEEEEEEEEEEERQEPNLVAPAFMRQSARRGLRLHEEGYSGDGLKPQTVEDARKMAESTALSEDKWRRIGPWIARHTGDLDAVQGGEITPGLVAMLLWGGGSSKSSARRAQDYAERLVARLDEKRYDPDQPRDEDGKFGSGGGGGGGEDKKNTIGTNESKVEVDPDLEEMAGTVEYAAVAEDVINEQQSDYVSALDGDTHSALGSYTGNAHANINKQLRGAPPPPPPADAIPRLERQAQRIDGAIRGAPPLEQGIIVYRGIGSRAEDSFQDAPVGATFTDKGIVSTSLNLGTAEAFTGTTSDTLLKVRVPAGSNALTVGAITSNPGEFEVLLPTQTTFTVVGKERLGDGRIVVVVDAATGN